jgi:hypothetical protein
MRTIAEVGLDGADVDSEHVVAGRRRPLCSPRA